MVRPFHPVRGARILFATFALFACLALPAFAAVVFSKGDPVRLTRSETLLFKGENFLGAPKGQEFTVLQHDFRRGVVYVPFYKEDGSLIAVTLPADALELSPQDGWGDLLQGVEAFREQRFEDAKRLLLRASQDQQYRSLAPVIANRVNGAVVAANQARAAQPARAAVSRQAFLNTLQGLRDAAEQLTKLGFYSLAQPIEEGSDRLGALVLGNSQGSTTTALPPSKVDREDLTKRATEASRAVARCRQAVALHRLIEASGYIEEGLKAEPNRPELKALQARVKRGIDDADDSYKAADSMRRFQKGEVHALTALERGLKYCADHPKLIALKKEMQGAWEDRTAPPVTPAFLAAAGGGASAKTLEEGRRLYTTRCTECHDLELIDSRSIGSWRTAVAGMARRAHIDDAQQARIIEYLAAAQNGAETGKSP